MITAVVFFLFLGLIVFGPKKTIEIVQSVGRAVAQVKQATSQFQRQLHEGVRLRDKGDCGDVSRETPL
jgi:Sec-independent protein translocase protein TatA